MKYKAAAARAAFHRSPNAELIALRETYLRYQKQQDAADLLASGRPAGRSIMTRFSRPGGYINRPGIF